MRIDQGAQVVEPVGRGESSSSQFPQPLFHLAGESAGRPNQVAKKTGSLPLKDNLDDLPHLTQAGCVASSPSEPPLHGCPQPVTLFTGKEADRRGAG